MAGAAPLRVWTVPVHWLIEFENRTLLLEICPLSVLSSSHTIDTLHPDCATTHDDNEQLPDNDQVPESVGQLPDWLSLPQPLATTAKAARIRGRMVTWCRIVDLCCFEFIHTFRERVGVWR